MLSPGWSKAGGWRVASKKLIEVAPIVFQPLGPSDADTPVCAPPIETDPPGILRTGTGRRGVAMRGSIPPR